MRPFRRKKFEPEYERVETLHDFETEEILRIVKDQRVAIEQLKKSIETLETLARKGS